jgi:hypothetical protein
VELVLRVALLEDILATWAGALGGAREAYRGHAYRVYNSTRRLAGRDAPEDLLATAAAFHDLGIWSDGTFDYLAPSIARARRHVEEHAIAVDPALLASVIENHHRLRRWRGAGAPVVEAFRRADLVDVSRGWVRAGLPKQFLRELLAAFPYAGFHGVLVRTAFAWFVRHPLRPLPMLR